MPETSCLSAEDLRCYCIGALTPEMIERFSSHVEECPHCSERLADLETCADPLIEEIRSFVEADDRQELEELLHTIEQFPEDAEHNFDFASSMADEPLSTNADSTIPLQGTTYRMVEQIGKGGMGVVYKMHHVALDRFVAVKMLRPDRLWDPRSIARFESEIRSIGRMDHVHLVRATDAGKYQGRHYLVMEYIDGMDLGSLLLRNGPLQVADACEIVRQAALGVQHAFEHGVIHRDIKPSNLMLTRSGIVKVLDLGLAVLKSDSSATLDRAGTAEFMAPELWQDDPPFDSRIDVYSLGQTLKMLLTGRRPKVARESIHVVGAVDDGMQAKLPPKLDLLIMRMTALDPAERPCNAGAIADALAPFARGADLQALISGRLTAKRGNRFYSRIAAVLSAAGLFVAGIAFFGIPRETITPAVPSKATVNRPTPASVPFSAVEASSYQEQWARWHDVPMVETNSIGMKLVLIPPGNYLRGSTPEEIEYAARVAEDRNLHERQVHRLENEGPRHRVQLSRPYYLGMYEVTQSEFRAVMGDHPGQFAARRTKAENVQGIATDRLPVEHVTWHEAIAFCSKLSLLGAERKAGRQYRLPTEAEWEFACRAGSDAPRWFEQVDDLDNFAWYVNNSKGRPHEVGQKQPNPFGLFDTYGNVWEWCDDWYAPYSNTPSEILRDPNGPKHARERVLRGGSWRHDRSYCRSAQRLHLAPHYRNISAGFRVACTLVQFD